MLEDIRVITKKLFDEFMNRELANARMAYFAYIKLEEVIDNINLVANHYLALDFEENFLENSSKTPEDKWRWVFNKDLETLNKAVKEYIMQLNAICLKDEFHSILEKYYHPLHLYSFVRDRYNVGFVKPCSFELICEILDIKFKDNQTPYIFEFKKIDLSTFEKRKELQTHLNNQNEALKKELNRIKNYIFRHYTIDDLLKDKL
jgi:hypothetical protein